MEKQWVEDITESPQFRYGLIHSGMLEKQPFEDPTADFDQSEFYDSDESLDDDIPPIPNLQEDLIKYFKQIRESRGYDLDVYAPRCFRFPLAPGNLKLLKNEMYREGVTRALNAAMENINAESKKVTGLTYEFVEYKKIVGGYPFYSLFTFTARVRGTDVVKTLQAMVNSLPGKEPEVLEWRVKPESSSSDSTEGSHSAKGSDSTEGSS